MLDGSAILANNVFSTSYLIIKIKPLESYTFWLSIYPPFIFNNIVASFLEF